MAPASPTGARLLIVDDAPEVLSLLKAVLSRRGYEVLLAPDGEAAVERLSTERIDVLIVDQNLPRMHGSEVIAHARALQPNAAIIFATALVEGAPVSEGLEGYLTKPFASLKVVEDTVRAALEAKRRPAGIARSP
jgi:CheY-like chemotaxis protein